jgi:hypothetical protein
VAWYNQGHWYFPVATLFVSMAALSLLAPLERRLAQLLWPAPDRAVRYLRWCSAGWLGVATACVVAVFVHFHRQLDYHRNYADFYFEEAPRVRAHYGNDTPQFLEADDGIVAYSLGYPTMSNSMGLDPAGAASAKAGNLLPLALERRYDRLTSLVYVTGDRLGSRPSSQELSRWAQAVVPVGLPSAYGFTLDYRSADGHFAIVRAQAR